MLEALFALVLLIASIALATALAGLWHELDATRDALFRTEIAAAEAQRLARAERQLAEMQQLTETVVSVGASVVQTVHRRIAAIPFGILEAIPVTRDTTRIVRKTHDLISDAVYGSIGAINRGVGSKLREGLQGPGPVLDRPIDEGGK
ncbi:MAG: hypothetical protein ACT4PZ_08405 [Panacagrimonas sp.]